MESPNQQLFIVFHGAWVNQSFGTVSQFYNGRLEFGTSWVRPPHPRVEPDH
jgi:hypothetical protein